MKIAAISPGQIITLASGETFKVKQMMPGGQHDTVQVYADDPSADLPPYFELSRFADVEVTDQTWTFCGYWENDRIIVEYVLPGVVEDDRHDDGEHEQGLWAAAGSGPDLKTAQSSVIAEYEEAVR